MTNLYNVYFDGSFVGYCWASDKFDAIIKVIGDYAFNEDGNFDYRYSARLA